MELKQPDCRLWEIDFLRGFAIILMIIFHFIYDLNHFSIIQYTLWKGPFAYAGSITASIFVVLVGVSLTINYNKKKTRYPLNKIRFTLMKRGVKLLFLGFLITLISYVIIPERFVIFGILHCIGISIILSTPFLTFTKINLVLGSLFIVAGLYLRIFTFVFPWLLPFGFLPPKYFTIDYFPLLPWFGVILLGIAIGNIFYPNGQRRYYLEENTSVGISKNICFVGRHSLPIYILHQPILISVILLVLSIH